MMFGKAAQPAGAEPPMGETTHPAISDTTHNHDQQQ